MGVDIISRAEFLGRNRPGPLRRRRDPVRDNVPGFEGFSESGFIPGFFPTHPQGYLRGSDPGPLRAPITLFFLRPDQFGAKSGDLCTRVFHPGPIYDFLTNLTILRGLLNPF